MVFLDANILIEIALGRSRYKKIEKLLSAQSDTALSILSVHLLIYFGLKSGIDIKLLEAIAEKHQILDITYDDYLWAKKNCVNNDFEDALQVARAIRGGATKVLTIDRDMVKNYGDVLNFELIK
ncbi:MAG: type II toxin-antitoxin system VapC family toxin [Patescibacteria group bacterium]